MGMSSGSREMPEVVSKRDEPFLPNVGVAEAKTDCPLKNGLLRLVEAASLDERSQDALDSTSSFSKFKQSSHKRHAEVFRTDFISAMKLPDSHVLQPGDYVSVTDSWRQEWEKGVQVPVSPEKILQPTFTEKVGCEVSPSKRRKVFHWPKELIPFDEPCKIIPPHSNFECDYNLDDSDVRWLKAVSRIARLKKGEVDEITMERAITYFERKCFESMAHAVATKEGLSIEYDESTTCSICLSPDTEDVNEIVFCDACNMCAHQSCYGIVDIPDGSWLCRPCSRGIVAPTCVLCSTKGGALKRVKDSFDWVHVICAWWIPEVKIEDVDNIEKISVGKIPPSRKNLVCHLCHEKTGACIQCSVKRCVKAYHVTCAVKEGLEMKTVMVPEKNDVTHISYCSRHGTSPAEKDHHQQQQQAVEDAHNLRLKELRKLESEFYKLVNAKSLCKDMRLSKEAGRRLYSYWALKRKANDSLPLIPLTRAQQEKLSGKQGIVFLREQLNLEIEKFLYLRQDLERLRNLCYMITKREKVRRELHRMSQDVFYKQNDALAREPASSKMSNLAWIQNPSPFSKFVSFPHYVTEGECTEESQDTMEVDSNADTPAAGQCGRSDDLAVPIEATTSAVVDDTPAVHKEQQQTNRDIEEVDLLPSLTDKQHPSLKRECDGPVQDARETLQSDDTIARSNDATKESELDRRIPFRANGESLVIDYDVLRTSTPSRRLSPRLKRYPDDTAEKFTSGTSPRQPPLLGRTKSLSTDSKENHNDLTVKGTPSPQRVTRSRLASLNDFGDNGRSPSKLRRRAAAVVR